MKIWQKTEKQKNNKLVEEFTVGNDYILDLQLLPYDIEASIAHAKGLEKIGIFDAAELSKVEVALNQLQQNNLNGEIVITQDDEDCHTYIENYLTTKLGDLGKKIHTGRSRNDQVLVALQLYIQDHGKIISKQVTKLAAKFKAIALQNIAVPFPGYSHAQQAMITSLGHYFASYYEALFDDDQFLKLVLEHISQNPLGSAAGFGSNLPLDREFTTQELGFKKLQINSLYCQNSRAKFHSIFLEALTQIMLTIGTFADDMLLYTTKEFNYFSVTDEFTTGSSIMPQKKNQDVMELTRAKLSILISNQLNIKMLAKSLPSGYNRDYQLLKQPLFDSTAIVSQTLAIMLEYLNGLKPNIETIQSKISTEILSADIATELAQKEHIPFRDAYKLALEKIPSTKIDWQEKIKKHISLGSSGNLGI
jgi:argininosuccinate lyase